MYKYLLFDLDDTLLDFKTGEKIAISKVLKNNGVEPTQETVKLYSKINDNCWKEFEQGLILRQDIHVKRVVLLGQALGVKFEVEKFANEYFVELSKQGQVFDGALSLLEKLSKKGYVLGAITNGTARIQKSRIKKSGLGRFFNDNIFISEEIGLRKPEKAYFDYVIDNMGITDKSKVLVLGDSISSDILGASNSGLDSCFVSQKGKEVPKGITATYTVNELDEIISVCKL